MKKSDIFYFIGVGVLLVGIVLAVIFKFVLNPRESFEIKHIDQLKVTDLSGTEVKLIDLLSTGEASYCLIFDLNSNCFSCVYQGIEDLKNLKNAGKICFGLVIHDSIEEVKVWGSNYKFSPFLMLKKLDFFNHIKSVKTPVFVKIKRGKVESYRYITAN
ncbi:MAG: hypothetical protein JSV88_10485 [Candidatus Aminicenantes bacterium]|nr:MAG: hypothetical protein JSV88_10485 [Candidatus Aminicenantes bacterium]